MLEFTEDTKRRDTIEEDQAKNSRRPFKSQSSVADDNTNHERGRSEERRAQADQETCDESKGSNQDNNAEHEVSKLQREIESLKAENLADPVVIKYLHNDLFSADQQYNRSKDGSKTKESSQDLKILNSENSRSFPNAYSEKGSEMSPSPPFNPHADMFCPSTSNRSTSPMSRSKKSVSSTISSSLDSHKYFSELLDHDPEGANEQYHFVPASGIHGSTSKVVATQHRRKVCDWNILPKVGTSLLVRAHSFNVINVPIDGEIKQILYTPSYNKNFNTMNIFISFNSETTPKDSLIHSKKRLVSFGNYITHYLKSRMYAYQCYPFFIQGSEEDTKSKAYASVNSSHDYSEIETIISLWHMQAQKFYTQTNSSFFSSEVVQILLQRKMHSRHQSVMQSSMFVQEKGTKGSEPEPIASDSIEEIDVLLLRPLADAQLGWQMAYDEPNLNIADYPLDLSPWRLREEGSDQMLGSRDHIKESPQVKIVSREDQLDLVNKETAGEYLFDCMDRRIGDLAEDFAASSTQMLLNATEEIQGKHFEGMDSSKKKSGRGRAAKRSGLASLFKRKHTPSTPESSVGAAEPMITDAKSAAKRSQSIQNTWLEDYFSRSLGNYKRVGLPTQYFLPEDITATKSPTSVEDETEARKAYLFSKESLQIRLPFSENTIPIIYAPWVWSSLSYNKWKPLLREMYRCVIPGGFALGAVYDLKVANTFGSGSDNLTQEFPSTLERDKTFDAITLKALNDGVHVFPTKHLVQAFKSVGFSNVKFSLLSFKTGDFSTDMGCLNELFSQIIWDILLRREIPDPSKPPKDTNPTTLFQRYIREHMGKIDQNSGCFRILLIVGQKPNKNLLPQTQQQ